MSEATRRVLALNGSLSLSIEDALLLECVIPMVAKLVLAKWDEIVQALIDNEVIKQESEMWVERFVLSVAKNNPHHEVVPNALKIFEWAYRRGFVDELESLP